MQIISYDAATGTLLVESAELPRYEVFDLPPSAYQALLAAPSVSDYFYKNIWSMRLEHDRHWPDISTLLAYMEEDMLFMDTPVTVNSTEADGTTPLHIACTWGDVGAVDLLIASGAPINARGDMDTTPLYDAVGFNRMRCIEHLLQAGATVDDTNQMGWTAREMATYREQTAVLDLFLQYSGKLHSSQK